jgi:hypothetical protein
MGVEIQIPYLNPFFILSLHRTRDKTWHPVSPQTAVHPQIAGNVEGRLRVIRFNAYVIPESIDRQGFGAVGLYPAVTSIIPQP